jgi:hypothetical protein
MSTKRRSREKTDLSVLDFSSTRALSSHVPDALLASMYRGHYRRSEGTRKRLFASIVENVRSRVGSEEALVPCWYVAGHMNVPPPIWLSLLWPALEDRFCAVVADLSRRSGCMPALRENVVPSIRAIVVERASVDSTYPKTCPSGSGTSLFLMVSGLIEQVITTFLPGDAGAPPQFCTS